MKIKNLTHTCILHVMLRYFCNCYILTCTLQLLSCINQSTTFCRLGSSTRYLPINEFLHYHRKLKSFTIRKMEIYYYRRNGDYIHNFTCFCAFCKHALDLLSIARSFTWFLHHYMINHSKRVHEAVFILHL